MQDSGNNTTTRKEVISMADKKENCGCGCVGQPQKTQKPKKDKKKSQK